MRDTWRQVVANRPAAIGAGVICAMIATGLAFMITAGVAGNASIAVNGAVWLFLAAVLGAPFAFGYWAGRRPRKIRAEQQLDMVTETALEIHGMLKGAQPAEPFRPVVHQGGRR